MTNGTHPNAEDHVRFVTWLGRRLLDDARGTSERSLVGAGPSGRFWLGRLSPVAATRASRLGAMAERLDPCAAGVRFRPAAPPGWRFPVRVRAAVWVAVPTPPQPPGGPPPVPEWRKVGPVEVRVEVSADLALIGRDPARFGEEALAVAFSDALGGASPFLARIEVEVLAGEREGEPPEVVVTVVNDGPAQPQGADPDLYEVELEVDVGDLRPYELETVRGSFRYERTVPAYGINSAVEYRNATLRTADAARVDRPRPRWRRGDPVTGRPFDLRFATLADDPLPVAEVLHTAMGAWADREWSPSALDGRARAEGWTAEMRAEADAAAAEFEAERGRLREGIDLLASDASLRRAFQLANRAFAEAARRPDLPAFRAYDTWRAFQLGFVLTLLPSLVEGRRADEARRVDTLWFATGGGKTETYLCLVVTAAFLDRLVGKLWGISAWSRFPLRMLSLQQTQRFADILASAELVRQQAGIGGEPFSLGYLVGRESTPNDIPDPSNRRAWDPDANDPAMPARYRVLLRCPFCGSEALEMAFDRGRWTLNHECRSPGCPGGVVLPLRIVDSEIYRFLPTVVVGTLDKAASVGIQAAMRGLFGAPLGICPHDGHGFTYSRGCLFPGCAGGRRPHPLPQPAGLFAPRLRIQDELHLLRDSLGATDAHYESILDHLQAEAGGGPAKIVGSSATLSGYEAQLREIYRREGSLFPVPGPRASESFWAEDSEDLARCFLGVAPRGVTLEYAAVRATQALQTAVRNAGDDPTGVAAEVGLSDPTVVPALVDRYGTDVIYGTTLRDIEAAVRSFETQVQLDPLNHATLTGRVPFDEVRQVLARLENPEPDFGDRLHLIAASSMLSHGVDVDRLNVMVVLGIPLTTAEFIQTTSRIGRRWPGLVVVLHKILRERDASVFRYFGSFVTHADRLVEPVPVTRRSRQVLKLTFPGLFMARLLGVHEPRWIARRGRRLWSVREAARAVAEGALNEAAELAALVEALGFTGPLDEGLRRDLEDYVRRTFRAISAPGAAGDVKSALPDEPMLSLRDVEEQVPIEDIPRPRGRGRGGARA